MDDAARLERLLCETILRFWNATICDDRGGYKLNHDRSCVWQGPARKTLVTQARTLWFFSRLRSSPYFTNEHAQCAQHGFAFLATRLLDPHYGGYFWEVDYAGAHATKPAKHLYGQAFALYALSEYAAAFDDTQARTLAGEIFSLIDDKAHDAEYGGYIECFDRQWQTVAAPGYLRPDPPMKLLNTHLHLLEAIMRYYEVTGHPVARERLVELVLILSTAVVRKNVIACTDVHRRDWTPVLDRNTAVSYGHDLEAVWMLHKACEAVGTPAYVLRDLMCSIADAAIANGFDRRSGGFYHAGPLGKRARDRSKVWWVQAEALVALATLWRFTGEERYRAAFTRTLDWIWKRQADWKHGEWFAQIDARGRASGVKAGAWKGPYHQGRALLESLALVRGDS